MARINLKTFSVFVLATIIVVVGFLWYVGKDAKFEKVSEGLSINTIDKPIIEEADTDQDGLKDWEEVLWGTDPELKDTDSDGTSDFNEIKENRDPNVAGPNDLLANTQNQNLEYSGEENYLTDPSLTATDVFARDFFANYIELSGRNIPTNIQSNLYGSVVENVTENLEVKEYTKKDLFITNNNAPEAAFEYGSAVGKIINKYAEYAKINEPELLQNLLLEKGSDNAEKLEEAASLYDSIAKELLALEVPSELVDFHLNYVNSYYGMGQSVYKMSKALIDPVGAMVGFRDAREYMLKIESLLREADKNSII